MLGIDLVPLIKTVGYAGIWTTIILENGILMLFFLPGDTLLFAAGFMASQKLLNVWILMFGSFAAAILGYMLGYYFGGKSGKRALAHGGTRFLKLEHLEMTRRFYKRYGRATLVLGRFLPIRGFISFLAGVSHMDYRLFMAFNILGAAVWTVSLILLGYFFGKLIPAETIDQYIIPIVLAFVAILALPVLLKLYKDYRDRQQHS